MSSPIFEKKNILVIGGAGFIGSHLCDELIRSNKVICVDNFLTGSEKNIDHLLRHPDFAFIKHDITEPLELEKMPELAKFRAEWQGVQEIYFAACPDSPKDYLKYPVENLLIHSLGLKNSLDLAVKYQAKFLFLSGSDAYGNTPTGPRGQKFIFREDYQGIINLSAKNGCYAEGERFGECLAANYREKYRLDAKIVRVFDTYGPRMRFLDGRLIPDTISLALDNKPISLEADGNDWGGFCYVSDLIKGLVKTMNSTETGPINLGGSWEIKLADLAQKIIELSGSQSKLKFGGKGLPPKLPDIGLAKEKLGWFPVVMLADGLRKTIDDLRAGRGLINI